MGQCFHQAQQGRIRLDVLRSPDQRGDRNIAFILCFRDPVPQLSDVGKLISAIGDGEEEHGQLVNIHGGLGCLDFLLKPIRYNKFIAAIDKAKEWFSLDNRGRGGTEAREYEDTSADKTNLAPPYPRTPAPSTTFLKVDGEYRQIAISDIIYVSGMKDYVMFYLESERRPLVTHLTMKAVEDMLPPQQFMRVHRSFIVCLDKIRKVDRNYCIYIGEEIIHVTEAYLATFQEFLNSKFPGK